MEMFSLTTQGTFVKHLPAATLSALEKSGALQTLQQYSTLTTQLHSTGNQLETFETGPVLLTSLDPKTNLKVEVIVDSDSQQGEDDNIVLTFRTYKDKDKEVQRTPFMPRITFAMKMESGVWKLNEILVTIRLPLADPDFLKSITDGIKSRTATPAIQPQIQLTQSPSIQTQSIQGQAIQNQPVPWQPGMQNHGFDNSIQTAMRSILTAEIAYSATYRAVGYTCTLSDLDGFGGGEPTEHQAMLIPSGLASGKSSATYSRSQDARGGRQPVSSSWPRPQEIALDGAPFAPINQEQSATRPMVILRPVSPAALRDSKVQRLLERTAARSSFTISRDARIAAAC